jgi:hypothetical protein
LFPTLTLQRAWRLHGREWVETCREVRAQNKGYCTVSTAVPIEQLLAAISEAICVQWEPESDDDFFNSAEARQL